MIDSRELRIGNWVETYMVMSSGGWFDKDGKHHGQNIITEPAIRQKQIDINDLKIISESQFATYRPIPLTPEILVACGFEREERGDSKDFDGVEIVYFFKGVDIYDHRENGGGFSYATYTRYPNRGFKAGVSVESLHHLQNLIFALTQTEITINLK